MMNDLKMDLVFRCNGIADQEEVSGAMLNKEVLLHAHHRFILTAPNDGVTRRQLT